MHESHMEPVTGVSPADPNCAWRSPLFAKSFIIWYVRLKISSIRNSLNRKYIDKSSLNIKPEAEKLQEYKHSRPWNLDLRVRNCLLN